MKTALTILLCLFLSAGIYGQEKTGVIIEFSTKFGNMDVLLYDATPKHQENFIKLVKEGYFENQLFHRVINNFMIQGGDPNSIGAPMGEMLGMGGPGYTVPAEIRDYLYHKKGAIAAARKGDMVNPEQSSSGSQFYIVQGQVFSKEQLEAFVKMEKHKEFSTQEIEDYTTIGGTPHLDDAYTVFGEVINGLDIIDRIASTPVDEYNRPLEDVVYKIRVVDPKLEK